MNEREYDRIHNEGCEGYNPYREERERKEIEDAIAYGKTRAGLKDRICRLLEAKDCSIARECGTYNQVEIDSLRAEMVQIEAQEEAEFLADWPLDITKERRATWNNRVNAGEFTIDGRVDYRALGLAERKQGWTMKDLKKAIKHHNI